MRRLASSVALISLLLTSCTSAPPEGTYTRDDLTDLILTEAPPGTVLTQEPEVLSIEDVSDGSTERHERFSSAGFIAAAQSVFRAGELDPRLQGFLMTSRAYLFEDPVAGLEAIRQTVEQEGRDTRQKAALFPDRPGFTITGLLDEALPPGTLLAWQKGNVIMLLAVVAVSAVAEDELRSIAKTIDAIEPT